MSPIRSRISEGMTRERLGLEIRRASRPFALWLAMVTVGIGATGFVLSHLNVSWPWQHPYEVRVAVADAHGVVPRSNDVRIAGVPVGNITKVALEHGQAVLTAQIARKYAPLYRDAQLRLRPSTPLQDMYLDVVDRGTPGAGELPERALLDATRTQTAVDLGQVIDVFDADVRPQVSTAIQALGRGLADHGADLRQALVELAPFLDAARRLAHTIAVRDRQTRRLVHNFGLMSEALATRDREVNRLVRGGAATFDRLARVNHGLGALIAQLPATLRVMPRAYATLRSAAAQLDPTAGALLPVTKALPIGLGALERLSPDARAGLAALDRPLPRLTGLMRAAAPVARSLGDSFAQLRPQAPRYDHITAAIVPCELAVQKFFAWTLSIAKFSDVHGLFPRGQAVTGAHSAGIADPGLTAGRSCAGGGPRK
jgi:phospholipid/cholesterol/gamma-HCH transport system substrate-binding protein